MLMIHDVSATWIVLILTEENRCSNVAKEINDRKQEENELEKPLLNTLCQIV